MTHSPSTHEAAAATTNVSSLADVEVRKGNLSPAQTTALHQVIEGVAEAVEREKNAKPDTRGHFGLPTRSIGVNTDNPLGFRSSALPTR